MNFISRFRNTRQAWVRGLIASSVFFSGLGITEFLDKKLSSTMAMETRLDAEQIITHLGYNIESHLKSYALVASTIKTYIKLHNGKLTQDQITFLLGQVFEQSEYLRNIGLAPANRLSYVYPLKGNEAAIGLYYPNLPRQWPAIQHSQEHNQPTIVGPIDLVQGGRALLYYTPVFLEDGSYWGLISFVIDANRFFNGTLLTFGGVIQPAALRYKPDESGTHEVFWGDALTFSGDPVLSDVATPGVTWQLALSPDLPDEETLNNVRLQGGIVSVLLALLTMALLRAQARYVTSYHRLVSISSQIPGVAFQYCMGGERTGRFSYLSQGVRELYAIDPQTACTEDDALFTKLMPEDRERIQSDVLNSAFGLTRWHGLYRLNLGDLGLRWHEYDAVPTRNGGQVTWHGHIADVTDRVKAESEYTTMLATTHDGFLICDYLGRFLEVNDAYCQLIGYSREELLKMSITEVDAVSTHQQIDQNLEMIITREYARFETRHRHKDGHIIDVDVSVSALTKGDDRMIVFVRDISERKHQESRLRDSENRFRSMANSAPVLIWLSDTDRHRYWFNQIWLDFTGRTVKEESGMGWVVNIHPDDQTECLRILDESQSSTKPFVMEYRLRHKDGEYRWVRDNGVPSFDVDAGTFLGYIGSCIDVTDYRKAMDRVRESEERLQFAFDGTGDGVWDWNIPDGQIFFSQGWKEMLGYHNLDIGNTVEEWRTRIHPDDLDRVLNAIRLHFAGQTPSYISQHRMRCKEGQYRWVLDRGRLVSRDEQGQPQRMLGTHTDITAMKNAEAEMAARESRFRVLFEHTPVAYQALDQDGRFLDVNQPLCDLLGYPREALMGRSFSEFLVELDSSNSFSYVWLAPLKTNALYSGELTLKHRSGRAISILINGRVQLDLDGEFVRIHCVLADISVRKQVEDEILNAKLAAERLVETRTLFLANMSHEIRTPMNAVLGFLQLLQQTGLSIRQLDYASKAQTAAESLLNILNDILNFSKIESGKLELELTPFRLDEGLRNLSLILVSASRDKDLDILFDVSPNVPEMLIGDPLRLHQVLLNLASNAVKFTARGEVVIALRDVMVTPEDVLIEFSVTDTGVGISEEKLSAIFEGFTQAESSTTRHYGGTGLGLAISQRLVRLMGGELTVSSQLGVGSCFSFTLAFPYQAADTGESVAPTTPLRVLVVDDNPHGIASFQKLGRRIGWLVDAADSGQAALDQMTAALGGDESRYQAVFIDRRMEPMDGLSTLRELRRLQYSRPIPIILMDNRQTYVTPAEGAVPDTDRPDAVLIRPSTGSMLLDAYTEACAANEHQNTDEERKTKGNTLAGYRLLLVEDNLFNQQVASELLTRNGATVDIANNGKEGVEQALSANPPYDAILMDVQMPVMDGYEATRQIRQKGHPEQIIIAMTANAFKSDQDACLAAGMNAYIGKPFTIDNVLRVIVASRTSEPTAALPETLPEALPVAGKESSTETERPVIFAVDTALDMLDQDRDLLAELVRMFWETYPAQHELLDAALKAGDLAQAKSIAHTLKGNAGYFSALEFKDWAAQLEILCRDDRLDEARTGLAGFEAAVERFRQACVEQGLV